MRGRIRAARAIARRQITESLLTPGLAIMASVGLGLGLFLVAGFTDCIDSSGFDPRAIPTYDFISRIIVGVFGPGFMDTLFAEGPFVFALAAGFLPVLASLSISSVYRFGQEKNAGAVELLAYGPADGTSYMVAAFLKDTLLSALCLAAIGAGLLAAAGLTHLVPGPLFFWSAAVAFLLCVAVFAYGALFSILASNVASALALSVGAQLLFLLLAVGSFSLVSAPVRSISAAAASALQWISPWFYCGLCFRAVQAGNPLLFAAGSGALVLLAAGVLCVGHLAIERKGVRP